MKKKLLINSAVWTQFIVKNLFYRCLKIIILIQGVSTQKLEDYGQLVVTLYQSKVIFNKYHVPNFEKLLNGLLKIFKLEATTFDRYL